MQNIVVYSLLRLVLLAATVGIVWWIAGISLLSTLAAIIIATLLSILLLGGARRKATSTMESWDGERKQRRAARRSAVAPDSDESVEDAALEDISGNVGAPSEAAEARAEQDAQVEEGGSDRSAAEGHVADHPAADRPETNPAAAGRPVTDLPVSGQPGTDRPATDPSESEAEREER